MISYEKDFYGWTQEQTGLLRAGRLSDLDIEEIETMGRSEKRELQNRLTGLLVHLLKWACQAERYCWPMPIDWPESMLPRKAAGLISPHHNNLT